VNVTAELLTTYEEYQHDTNQILQFINCTVISNTIQNKKDMQHKNVENTIYFFIF
jgi:hypothetical protein